MNPLLQDKLLDLVVNIIAIILGGGLVMLAIEWRRHQREVANWQREDETIQIDIPVARITPARWKIEEKMSDTLKLHVYKNQLEGTIRQFVIYSEFVIRNTTPAEIVITSYGMDILNIPSGPDELDFYDLETFDPVTPNDMGAIRLRPYATIPRAVVFLAYFNQNRKLEESALPTTITISVKTSSGKVIQQSNGLTRAPLGGLISHGEKFLPIKYYGKIVKPEPMPDDDVPF